MYEFLLTLTFNLDVVKASSNKTATLKHKSVAVICCFHPYPLRSSSLNDLKTFEKTLYDSFYIISVSITFSCEGHLCNEALSVSNSISSNSSHINLPPTVVPTDFFAKIHKTDGTICTIIKLSCTVNKPIEYCFGVFLFWIEKYTSKTDS